MNNRFTNKSTIKKAVSLILCACMFFGCIQFSYAAKPEDNLPYYIESAFVARRERTVQGDRLLSSPNFTSYQTAGISSASSTLSDWVTIAMARYSVTMSDGTAIHLFNEDYDDYLLALKKYVNGTYAQNNGFLSQSKATEWHRLIITLCALGGNPQSFGSFNAKSINLLADSTYNSLIPLSRQGINGMIFALISKNLNDFSQGQNVKYTDEYMINYILSRRLSDGGWALSSSTSDVDMTAMVLAALSFYNSDNTSFTGTNVFTQQPFSLSVPQAINGALNFLSEKQSSDGGFVSSWGEPNAESTAQVITALCCLNVDVQNDKRFIKNSNTLLNGLLKYRLPDGSFAHSLTADSKTPSFVLGEYNAIATDQCACALVAMWRQQNKLNTFYNMRPDVKSSETGIYIVLKWVLQSLISKLTSLFNFIGG